MAEMVSYTKELTGELTRAQLIALIDYLAMCNGLYNDVARWCKDEREFDASSSQKHP
jgi:hypothetical protein